MIEIASARLWTEMKKVWAFAQTGFIRKDFLTLKTMVPTVWSSHLGFKELSIKVWDKKEKLKKFLFLKRADEIGWNFLHLNLNDFLYQELIFQKITLKYENMTGNSNRTWQMQGS